ncbi:MAG: putative toxin-antitoxin system antitoxin component (TIGR02293 family) [Motiliproteus sp.]|jgi:putative toxin-antitoxin system antitoxin component (TIGR02293 family)
MNTLPEPIARPKPGSAKPNVNRVNRDSPTARIMTVKKGRQESRAILLNTVTGVASGNRATMLRNIRQGLPFNVIEALEQAYAAPRKELAEVLSITVSTLSRRKKEGRLHADESDRVARLARIKDTTVAMMQGDDDAAIKWLHTPLEILGNEAPMVHASTEMGSRDVEDLIGRIRHGVFS